MHGCRWDIHSHINTLSSYKELQSSRTDADETHYPFLRAATLSCFDTTLSTKRRESSIMFYGHHMWPLRVIDPEVQFCRWSTYCGISSLCHVSMETYVKSHTVLNLCLKLLVILEEWIYPSDRSQINEIGSVTISFAEFLLWTPFRFFIAITAIFLDQRTLMRLFH